MHCFWTETLLEDPGTVIQYARFDGAAWSTPNEIHVSTRGIESLSPSVDHNGQLYLAWTEGLIGPAFYTHAPAHNALSAQNWAPPLRIGIPAGIIQLRIDSKGNFHVLYINRGEELGVYYVRSEDQGRSWSEPAWLDPDIPPDHTPAGLAFEADETDGLHAIWNYGALVARAPNASHIRYTHSLDGGDTWSSAFMIDRSLPEIDHNLTAPGPIMAVQGQTVHVVWAAGQLPYRHHRYSTDAGETWSASRRIFGDLHGQAGDSLAVDGAGRVHFFGQIRYPIGIYHAYWDQAKWTPPSLIYLIAQEVFVEGNDDRVHAHSLSAVVRAGNQLVLTFTDPSADPNRRLFVMHRLLDDLEPLEPLSTPAPTGSRVPEPSSTPLRPPSSPTRTTQPLPLDSANEPFGHAGRSGLALTVSLVPLLLLLAVVLAVRLGARPRS